MEKDFDEWNRIKKRIHRKTSRPFCHERELWWCTLGVNIGSEQDGPAKEFRRPVLVLRAFGANTYLIIPLTSSSKIHPLRPSIGMVEGKDAHALLSQMRVIDTKRLVRKMGMLEQVHFEYIRKTVRDLL